jgi:hypothetical protein
MSSPTEVSDGASYYEKPRAVKNAREAATGTGVFFCARVENTLISG